MNDLESARRERAIITAELRILKAIKSKAPGNAILIIEAGDHVRVYRETDKRYLGPYLVILAYGNPIFVVQNDR